MESTQKGATSFVSQALEAWHHTFDTNLRVFQQLTDFGANMAKEGIGLYAELQASNLEALQEGKTCLLQRLRLFPEAASNPAEAYQQQLREGTDHIEKILTLWQNNLQAVLRSGEQCWMSAQQASRSVQSSYRQWYEQLTSMSPTAP